MCIVPHVETKSVFTFQPIKRLVSTTVNKKCKTYCNVLKIPLKEQNPTFMLFGGDGTHCFAKKSSRDNERPSLFEEISPPITTKHIRT